MATAGATTGAADWSTAKSKCIYCGESDFCLEFGPRTFVECVSCQSDGCHCECEEAATGVQLDQETVESEQYEYFCSKVTHSFPPFSCWHDSNQTYTACTAWRSLADVDSKGHAYRRVYCFEVISSTCALPQECEHVHSSLHKWTGHRQQQDGNYSLELVKYTIGDRGEHARYIYSPLYVRYSLTRLFCRYAQG